MSSPLPFLLFSVTTATLLASVLPTAPTNSVATAPTTPHVITQACGATRFPALCASSLSSSLPDPTTANATQIAAALLLSSASGAASALSSARSLLSSARPSDPNLTNAATNCVDFLTNSGRRLSSALSALRSGCLPAARALASAAELYQYDCWSALKYVNNSQEIADDMAALAALANLTADANAVLAAVQRYGSDMAPWAPPETERDGYWPESGAGDCSGSSSSPARGGACGGDPDVTVCKGGKCRYESVQAAVDAAPELAAKAFVIYIKGGVYEETVRVGFNKTNLVFVGDGMGVTVITGSLNADTVGVSTYNTATVGVNGDGFMACNLTIANTAGPDKHQAVALRSDSDQSIFQFVECLGHQDTLYAHSLRQFYKSCKISGTVDFIFGNSASVFDNCTIIVVPRQLNPERGETDTVTAHGRTDPAQSTGFVFNKCVVNGSDDYLRMYHAKPAAHRVYLGRPWKEYSRTVFIECYLSEIVRPEGWSPWSGDFALNTLYYGEYESSGPGANVSSRVKWSSQISGEHLGVYSLENFIQGDGWIR